MASFWAKFCKQFSPKPRITIGVRAFDIDFDSILVTIFCNCLVNFITQVVLSKSLQSPSPFDQELIPNFAKTLKIEIRVFGQNGVI